MSCAYAFVITSTYQMLLSNSFAIRICHQEKNAIRKRSLPGRPSRRSERSIATTIRPHSRARCVSEVLNDATTSEHIYLSRTNIPFMCSVRQMKMENRSAMSLLCDPSILFLNMVRVRVGIPSIRRPSRTFEEGGYHRFTVQSEKRKLSVYISCLFVCVSLCMYVSR